jgi:acyl-CoA synthetase (AMP-forming)/AMP-acid ligase II/acyl carrier protein
MERAMPEPTWILDAMRDHAARLRERHAFGWFDAQGRPTLQWSVGELHDRALALAGRLLAQGLRPGDTALLVYPPSPAFFEAFVACLYAGVIPAAIYPPNPLQADRVELLRGAQARLGIEVALTNTVYNRARMLGAVRGFLSRDAKWPALRWIPTDSLGGAATPPPPRQPTRDELAFVQFTSGSTSAPRGVAITWRNLELQVEINRAHGRCTQDSVGVVWLPQYHDFGLVSSFLCGLLTPFGTWFCSPLDFLKRPACWPEMMHRARATHTAGPNFGYALVTRKTTAEERARWDLSSLQCCTWGAEVIQPDTVRGFCEAFAQSGLSPEAMISGWGLAEHTVAAAAAPTTFARFDGAALGEAGVLLPAAEGAAGSVELACAGAPLPGVALRVVDPACGRALPEGHVGELWLCSEGVSPGYVGDPEGTEAVFGGRLEGSDARWLRTGDLGGLWGGSLYVTGRKKELIIVRGRNLSPTDVEACARAAHEAIRPGGVAAVAVPGAESEGLGLMVELSDARRWRGRLDEVVQAVHAALRRHDLPLHVLALASPRTLPKTTSGKLRRAELAGWFAAEGLGDRPGVLCVRSFTEPVLTGELGVALAQEVKALRQTLPAGRQALAEQAVARLLAELLGLDAPPPATMDLRALGLDSLGVAGLSEALERATGRAPEPAELAELHSQAALADWLLRALDAGPPTPLQDVAAPVGASVPATSFQRLILDDHGPLPAWFGVLEVKGPLTVERLAESVYGLTRRHDLLRAAFVSGAGGLSLRPQDEPPPVNVTQIDLPEADDEALVTALRAALCAPMDLTQPPLLRVGLAPRGEGRALVGLAAHHLVYDAVALQTLISEWIGLLGGAPEDAPGPSFLALAARQAARAEALDDGPLHWWRAHLSGARWPMPVPEDVPVEAHRLIPAGGFHLEVAQTARLAAVAQAAGSTLSAAALVGWALAVGRTLGVEELITGLAVSTRTPAARAVVGPLVDDVLARVPLAPDATLAELMRVTSDELLQTAARVAPGFGALLSVIHEVGVVKTASDAPCPVLFTVHDWDALRIPAASRLLRGGAWVVSGDLSLRALPVDPRNHQRNYDYFALAERRDGALTASLRVSARRVGAEVGGALLGRWERALRTLCDDPTRRVKDALEGLE